MKIVLGMSGGVDSSVSALILKEQGYDIEALFMKNWNEVSVDGNCSWEEDVEDALRVCDLLNIPLNTIDLSEEYWDSVFTEMLDDIKSGVTPNPDILCNQEIKFRAFMEHAILLGAEKIATGHYAKIFQQKNNYQLHKSIDNDKDQTYFLCRLNQKQLSKSIFPIGDKQKQEVRTIAANNNLKVHNKKDSTGICFIGERPFKEFLSQYIPVKKGLILTKSGKILGNHDGVHFYTVGQRQGLGIGGIKGSNNAPWYVIDKDIDENLLYVAQGKYNDLLYSQGLTTISLHWIESKPECLPYQCSAKTRYRQPDQQCIIQSIDKDSAHVKFLQPQKAVTPGQYIVFYHGEICLGGGVIESGWN